MKKMQTGGVTVHKGKKGVTTKKSNPGFFPDVKHAGKKGTTTVDIDYQRITHKGGKGTTEVWNDLGNGRKSVTHKGSKGITVVRKDKNAGTSKVYYGSNDIKKPSFTKNTKLQKGGVAKIKKK